MTQRKLQDYEIDILVSKIRRTNPNTLFPAQRDVWDDIRKWIVRGQKYGAVYLSDKQCAVIHRAFWRSQTTECKLSQPQASYDVSDKLNVVANPMK